MHVFSLITQKGGAGKSILARQFAVLAGETGASILIDRDSQETSTKWWQRRQSLQPVPAHPDLLDLDGSNLTAAIKALRKQSGVGRRVVAAAAYRAGECLFDHELGRTQNYSAKVGAIHREIMLPDGAPSRWLDRETLWNEVAASDPAWPPNEVRPGLERATSPHLLTPTPTPTPTLPWPLPPPLRSTGASARVGGSWPARLRSPCRAS